MGLFRKEIQNKADKKLTRINENFLKENKGKRPENVLSVEEYTEKKLDKCEKLAKSLFSNGITPGNISRDKLVENNCKTLADRVNYANNKETVKDKREIFADIVLIIDFGIESNGFATKQEIYDSCLYSNRIIDKVLNIYKADLQKKYFYKRPTKLEMQQYGLVRPKFIYQRK